MTDKVLVLGIDGMDPKIVRELMSKSLLPNFKSLSESGSFLELETSNPSQSPVAWVSIATGVNPGKHGIFDFIMRNPSNYLPYLSLSKSLGGTKYESNVKVDSFWKITSDAGIYTSVIKWPITFPPEKINGVMLSGLGVPDIKGFLSGYSFYSEKEVRKSEKESNKVILIEKKNDVVDTFVYGPMTKDSEITATMKILIEDEFAKIIVNNKEHIIKPNEWGGWIKVDFKVGMFKSVSGIFKVYVNSVDPFEMFMTSIQVDPENSLVDISYPKSYSKSLGSIYTLGMPEEGAGYEDGRLSKEAFLAQIRGVESERETMFWREFKSFNKKEKAVLAYIFDSSDRIQHYFYEKKKISDEIKDYYIEKDKLLGEILDKLDDNTLLLVVSDHGISSFNRAVNINNWLVENGFMTLSKNIEDIDEGSLFEFVDWSKTKAYSLGFSSIYVNLKGREGQGIVEGKELVVKEIVNKLSKLKDNNKSVFNKLYLSDDIYDGSETKNSPDIVLGFNPGFRIAWQNAVGGFSKAVIVDNDKEWKGDHLIDPSFVPGVLFSNKNLNKTIVTQQDILPTILSALNIKISKKFNGESLI